jgi:hypothetical protein
MRGPYLLMTLLAAFCAAIAQEQPKPEAAMDAIMKAFDSHSVVMLGELHGNRQQYELLRRLVFSRHFADRVHDLVLEYGNALYQDVVDRYVAGESIPVEEVQKAWRNTTAIGPPSPTYGWLYEAVREANRKRHQKLRIVLGDVYVNWDRIKDREDLGPFVANRDHFYASVVKEQVMARHHRALLVAGYPHFLRSTAGPNLIERELRAAGAATFVIVPGTNTIDGYDDLDKRFDSWRRPPCIVALKGNWVGQLAALPVLSGGTIPSPPGENLRLEVLGDAFLYLGPRDSLTQIHTTRAELQGTAYGKELERRLEIMFGRPVAFVSAEKETPEFSRNSGPPPPLPPPPKSIHDPLPPKPPVN